MKTKRARHHLQSLLLMGILAMASFLPTRLNAQAVKQGNLIIEPYYGFPNLLSGILRFSAKEFANLTDEQVTISSAGPFGARAEYMVQDWIGVGGEFYYAFSKVEYQDETFDENNNPVTYHYSVAVPRPRFLARANFHIPAGDIVDPYAGVGLGYDASRFRVETDDPQFILTELTSRSLSPLAVRFAVGSRFMFTRYVGAGVELALGGPLVTGGVSIKF